MCQGYSVQLWSQGIVSGWVLRAGIAVTMPLLTLYCQQCVPVAAGYRGHQVWMRLLQLHRPWGSRFLVLPAQASPGSFPPRAHLAICRSIYTSCCIQSSPENTSEPPSAILGCLQGLPWPQHGLQAEESQILLQPRTQGLQPYLLRWPR